jgi:serine/threonine-protein kinase
MRPALSPDGKWLLYQSDESGRIEVYLRPYPDVRAARTSPVWRADGAALYYVGGGQVTEVSFTPAPSPRLGVPRPLFDLDPSDDRLGAEFGVSADGSRFLIMRAAAGPGDRAEVLVSLGGILGR